MKRLMLGASLGALLVAGIAGAAYSADYTPVTDARLANPEPENWLMTRGGYKGWSYSPLNQINTGNVKNLVPVWSVSTGVDSGHEAPPIVNNGVMFVATPYSQVMALDASSGDLLWRYKRKLPPGFSALHNTSRGVALYGDKVYLPALDATLVALDAKTGKVAWEAKVEDWKTGYYMTMAPLVVKGKVLVGVSGGEFGVRGYLTAYDINTGKRVWRAYSMGPDSDILIGSSFHGPRNAGTSTWRGEDWKLGGGTTWGWYSYDPNLNLLYYGTGNPGTWNPSQRPGDNKWSMTIFARNPDTGQAVWGYQMTPHDAWDYDGVNEMILASLDMTATDRDAAIQIIPPAP